MKVAELVAENLLGAFILSEMRKRDMSMREFATYAGVSQPTISRLVNQPDPPQPTLDFLSKLAKATGVDICTLVEMALPDESPIIEPNPELRLLAQRIRNLPPDAQALIETLIANTIFKNNQK